MENNQNMIKFSFLKKIINCSFHNFSKKLLYYISRCRVKIGAAKFPNANSGGEVGRMRWRQVFFYLQNAKCYEKEHITLQAYIHPLTYICMQAKVPEM